MTDTERVDYFDVVEAFVGAEIEREGVVVEVEHVNSADNDPDDDSTRLFLDVKADYSEDGDNDE